MVPLGGRQKRGTNRRLRPSSLAYRSAPRGFALVFSTNIHSTTVGENHIQSLASIHGASLCTEGTAAHWHKSQGPRGGLGQTKAGWETAWLARGVVSGLEGRKGPEGARSRR